MKRLPSNCFPESGEFFSSQVIDFHESRCHRSEYWEPRIFQVLQEMLWSAVSQMVKSRVVLLVMMSITRTVESAITCNYSWPVANSRSPSNLKSYWFWISFCKEILLLPTNPPKSCYVTGNVNLFPHFMSDLNTDWCRATLSIQKHPLITDTQTNTSHCSTSVTAW